jgi:type I restriction enzyme S subunit
MNLQTVKVSDVCEVIMGQAPSGDSYNDVGTGFPLIAGAGDFKNGIIKVGKYTTEPTKITKTNDIVMSIRASIGDKVWVDEGYCLGRGVAAIRASSKIDKNYLWHTLTHIESTLRSKGRGATFLQVNKDDIKDLSIPLPPIAEQQRIAALLDTADRILKQRESSIAKLDQLTQSVFVEMFGDPVRNTKNFSMKNIGELPIHIADGNYSSKYPSSSEFVESGIPFIRANNLKNLTLVNDDVRYITERKHSELAKGHLKFRDVVIVTRGEIGKVGLVPMEFDDANMNAQLVLLRPNSSMLLPEYLCHFFNNNYTKSYVKNFETGVALKQLPIGNLKKIQISLPPIELQNEFANIVKKIEIQIKFLNFQKASIYSMLSSLQHQSFAVN